MQPPGITEECSFNALSTFFVSSLVCALKASQTSSRFGLLKQRTEIVRHALALLQNPSEGFFEVNLRGFVVHPRGFFPHEVELCAELRISLVEYARFRPERHQHQWFHARAVAACREHDCYSELCIARREYGDLQCLFTYQKCQLLRTYVLSAYLFHTQAAGRVQPNSGFVRTEHVLVLLLLSKLLGVRDKLDDLLRIIGWRLLSNGRGLAKC